MRVIVIGSGRVGQHVASELSREGHNVLVIDNNASKLKELSRKSDVAIKRAAATDARLLRSLLEDPCDLFLAVTDNDEANLVACSIAKHVGNVTTIARLKEHHYLAQSTIDIARLFHVDFLVVPEMLVAEEIAKIACTTSTYLESFFNGAVLLKSIQVPHNWNKNGVMIKDLNLQHYSVLAGLIKRPQQKNQTNTLFREEHQDTVIFPHGNDIVCTGDEVTFVGDADKISALDALFNIPTKKVESAFVCGGSQVGLFLSKILLEQGISVRLAETQEDRAQHIVDEFKGNIRVICVQGQDFEFLRAEHAYNHDVFIACTPFEDKNLLLALLAKELGCKKVIAVLSEEEACRLADKMGIHHVVSPKVLTTARILALSRVQSVFSITSLYSQRAEVIELKVSNESPLVGIPLHILGPKLPKGLLIAVIYNRGRFFIARGSHIIAPDDQLLVICDPKERPFIERFF